jgi:hypothetical protein
MFFEPRPKQKVPALATAKRFIEKSETTAECGPASDAKFDRSTLGFDAAAWNSMPPAIQRRILELIQQLQRQGPLEA